MMRRWLHRFAQWRADLMKEAWQLHVQTCWRCEQEKHCTGIQRITTQRDRWQKRADILSVAKDDNFTPCVML